MREVEIRANHGKLLVSGKVEVQGIDPSNVEFVIRSFFNPDSGSVWEAEHIPTGTKKRAWSAENALATVQVCLLEKQDKEK